MVEVGLVSILNFPPNRLIVQQKKGVLLFLTVAKELFRYLEQPQDKVRAWRRETSEEELDEEL